MPKNPFEDKNIPGVPLSGKFVQFFGWARKQELKRLQALPKEKREKELAAQKALAKRMDS